MILATNPQSMGERLRMYRCRKNMTKKELAKIIGVTPTTIRNYENDLTVPNIQRLAELSAALDVTISMVMHGREPENGRELLIQDGNPRE